MDSLVANYASSDDEEEEQRGKSTNSTSKSIPLHPTKSLFNSLPPPKSSSSIFSSLPPPKTTPSSSSSSSLFPSLPPPKSDPPPSKPTKLPPSDPNAKRVVQFTPPINPLLFKSTDDDDDDDEEEKRRAKRPVKDFSSKPFSSVIPPPKNSLGMPPMSSSFSARRSAVQVDVPTVKAEAADPLKEESGSLEDYGSYYGNWVAGSEVEGQWSSGPGDGDASAGWAPSDGNYYENYGSYGGSWDYVSAVASAATEAQPVIPDVERIVGKRGRNEIPVHIVEVKQDELVKNRPREDQGKLTGIAFGPAYQPVGSQKGKPSKQHKRKHQIGSLYFDMKQKEMEFAERRAKGMLTKRDTQGKYGW